VTTPTKNFSIVSPVYGCQACLEELVDRVESSLKTLQGEFELILVDDNSPDGSWQRIKELAGTRPWLKAIRLARNFGQHYAISAGIEKAIGEIVVVMDCDLQDVPEEIPKLIGSLKDGVEIAFAQRVDRQDGIAKKFGSWAFFRVLSWMTGVPQDHTTANFGAYTRKVIDTINSMPERERCFPLMVRWTGLRRVNVAVAHASRTQGSSSYSFKKLFKLATNIVLSYSDKPLRLVVRVGLLFSALAFVMVALSVLRYIHGDVQVAGFTSVIASVWLVGGMIIFSLGIIGLYLARLFMEAKNRPCYVVSESIE
jgi:polyisoprenyl-phosphate glycosyltransferase